MVISAIIAEQCSLYCTVHPLIYPGSSRHSLSDLIPRRKFKPSVERRREGSYYVAYSSSGVRHLPRDGRIVQLSISLSSSLGCFITNGIGG